ncbi:ThuA domain-containing protein [Sphingomonas psychrotolerans]|uniref:ThuA domain-containing protein n=1 Tax=Sphingomonas psychrotolerans TaxID=1327635 RepID=A0ABU3N5F5_9SPHN|nr:ThuA domain-containing protein [Sphingomonas psychrotolerans]MDT8759764.1 ThuA domain-containing protein [Sphingomonas psychrotolerans]
MRISRAVTALCALVLMGQTTPVPDPHRPVPTFDTVAPTLPPLRRPAILIFSKTNSYRHDSIPAAVAAVEKMVRARGWSSYATENAAVFNPAQLARFDAVVFASASGDLFTPEQRVAFQQWIAAGHGFVGLHAAGDGSHPDWYQAMLGYGGYTGHPGGADQFQQSQLILLDRAHPATRHLPKRWRWTEEYYAWQAPLRADAHVLARLDETGMRLEPKHTMGDRHALIWWRCEGKARIFYSALGHKPETFADPAHLRMIDGAIGWAARRSGKGCD